MDAVDAGGATLTDESGSAVTLHPSADFDAGTVTLDVDRTAFGGANLGDLEFVAGVGSEEYGAFRPVTVNGGGHRFGGAKADVVDNAPLLVDVTTPADVPQATALGYDADSLATLPHVPLSRNYRHTLLRGLSSRYRGRTARRFDFGGECIIDPHEIRRAEHTPITGFVS